MSEKEDNLSINSTVAEILSSFSNDLPSIKLRLARFVEEFNNSFPETKLEDKGRAEAITWALLTGALVLYALNLNGSVIVELHGVLERIMSRDLVRHLVPKAKRVAAKKVLERCNLRDSATVLQTLGILNKLDLKFVDRLSTLRNSVAHKNPKGLSNLLFGGKKISFLDIDSVMSKQDCLPLIISAIKLMIKLSKANIDD